MDDENIARGKASTLPAAQNTLTTCRFTRAHAKPLDAANRTKHAISLFAHNNLSALQALPAGLTTIDASAFEGANLSALEALPA